MKSTVVLHIIEKRRNKLKWPIKRIERTLVNLLTRKHAYRRSLGASALYHLWRHHFWVQKMFVINIQWWTSKSLQKHALSETSGWIKAEMQAKNLGGFGCKIGGKFALPTTCCFHIPARFAKKKNTKQRRPFKGQQNWKKKWERAGVGGGGGGRNGERKRKKKKRKVKSGKFCFLKILICAHWPEIKFQNGGPNWRRSIYFSSHKPSFFFFLQF